MQSDAELIAVKLEENVEGGDVEDNLQNEVSPLSVIETTAPFDPEKVVGQNKDDSMDAEIHQGRFNDEESLLLEQNDNDVDVLLDYQDEKNREMNTDSSKDGETLAKRNPISGRTPRWTPEEVSSSNELELAAKSIARRHVHSGLTVTCFLKSNFMPPGRMFEKSSCVLCELPKRFCRFRES